MMASSPTRRISAAPTPPPPIIYYENWLLKKEGVNNWVTYWVVIRDKWLQLFESGDDMGTKKELVKTLELTSCTQCTLVKRRKRRFPFSINNGLGIYYMKCETELQRYHWIFSLLTSALGKPKCSLPKGIPECMEEKEAFKRSPKKENLCTDNNNNNSNSTPTNKTATGYHSKRRQKYAERNEKRHVRKEAKRNRKADEQSSDKSPETHLSVNRADEFPRSQKIQLEVGDARVDSRSIDDLKGMESYINDNLERAKCSEALNECQIENNVKLKKSNETTTRKTIKVKVMMHPADDGAVNNVSENLGFEASDNEEDDEDENGFNRIEVITCINHVLPNMVMSQVSDIDSDTDSTCDTSIQSQNSLFPNLGSSNDVSDNFVTQDLLDIEPMATQSKIVHIREHRVSVTNDKPFLKTLNTVRAPPRVLSAGARLERGQGLIEKPLRPFERAVSPTLRSTSTNKPVTHFSRFMQS